MHCVHSFRPFQPYPALAANRQWHHSKIHTNTLNPDDQLTPSRVLAQELNVSRSTVQLAYDELLARGYVSTSRRGGTKVISSDHNAASPHIKTNRLLHFRQDLTLTRLKTNGSLALGQSIS